MRTWIQECLVRIIGAEGGYANRNPKDDHGGETKWGISKRSYPKLDIENLTLSQASMIYERDFIGPLLGRGLANSTMFQLLDFAVNSGLRGAVKQVQKELGAHVDGIIGAETIMLLKKTSESDLVMLITACRIDFMTSLKNWDANSKGWMRRLAENLRYGAIDTD